MEVSWKLCFEKPIYDFVFLRSHKSRNSYKSKALRDVS